MKATKKDLEVFERCGRKWEKVLGLEDWDIRYRLPMKKDGPNYGKGFLAKVRSDRNAMNATIILCTRELNHSESSLNDTALHELLHLTLRPLLSLGEARFNVDSVDMEYEEHRVIQRIVKLVKGV